MWQWYRENQDLAGWAFALSMLMVVGSVIVIPILLARLPADYFMHRRREGLPFMRQHPVVRFLLIGVKNFVGLLLVLVAFPMMPLPGQGLLTLLIGVSLLDFPGKYRAELWLVRRPGVLHAVNWIRRKADRPPLQLPQRAP